MRWSGIAFTVFCLLTSMFWFSQPDVVPEQVSVFLRFEQDWLMGVWDYKKVLLVLTIPISLTILAIAFWRRNLYFGLSVVFLIAAGKTFWSVFNAGAAGWAVIVPASVGLVLCMGLIYLGFRRLDR